MEKIKVIYSYFLYIIFGVLICVAVDLAILFEMEIRLSNLLITVGTVIGIGLGLISRRVIAVRWGKIIYFAIGVLSIFISQHYASQLNVN